MLPSGLLERDVTEVEAACGRAAAGSQPRPGKTQAANSPHTIGRIAWGRRTRPALSAIQFIMYRQSTFKIYFTLNSQSIHPGRATTSSWKAKNLRRENLWTR
jgi:hypothetical protein